jgi:transposase
MDKTEIRLEKKEAIIAEYLLEKSTYRSLGEKHGIDFRTIHSWVVNFTGKPEKSMKTKPKEMALPVVEIPTELSQLREELRKEKLHIELLNAMIDIAEKDLKISIRKKSGTKR